jgi:shikimate kinase
VRRNQARNVVLCGYYGCGKTSAGWELARTMRRQFVDVPQELARRRRSSHVRVPFWSRPPEPDELEAQLVAELMKRRDLVVALSAESLDEPDVLEETLEFSYLVFLDPPLDVLYARLLQMPVHRDRVNALGRSGIEQQVYGLRGAFERCDLQLTVDLPPARLATLIMHCFYT